MKHALPLLALLAAPLLAFAEPRPVPRMQAIPLPESQISFQREGVEIARYYFGADLKRPFVFPVIGPSGRSVSRMGHPHDPETHSHHNSVWIAHQNVGGCNYWEDRPSKARIAHQRVLRFEESDAEAFIETENWWLDDSGGTVIREYRRTSARPLENGEWLLGIDCEFQAKDKPVTFGQSYFGLVAARMAKTIGVNDGGGTIRNSEGGVDEAGCFRKNARWVDYAGPIAPGASEGLLLMEHPRNVNAPAPCHVRNDGWMDSAFTGDGPVEVKPGEPLRLQYSLWVHRGVPEPARLQARWEAFAKEEWREFALKKGK